ncbi:hypothetical protein BDQ12DRAFT_728047 [Crucibulum laeve]|uniref:Uncharacterized protein n=1 Tax=Crucibulum laeve TaxID=68775 RepID=A0A5C3LKK2_9AGAR|nr:hypothetical protein BDQ12DRAFT_728047 [Crucibulum laeve]
MGPNTNTIKVTKLVKLKEDGLNWSTYKDQIMTQLNSKDLHQHVLGMAIVPINIVKHEGWFYDPSDVKFEEPLSSTSINYFENAVTNYLKNEGVGCNILNTTIPAAIYCQLCHLPNLTTKWDKLCKIYEHHGNTVQQDLLAKLQAFKYAGGSMRAHLSAMQEVCNNLANNDFDVTDSQFIAYIRSSLKNNPEFWVLILSLDGAMETVGRKLTSDVLMWHLIN